jgi:PAS domain S-box-containing protein
MVRVPPSLGELVASAAAPLWVLELPSGKVLAANEAAARLLGVSLKDFIGQNVLERLAPDEQPAAAGALGALAAGKLIGYQARRNFRGRGRDAREVAIWVSAVDVDGGRLGLASAVPLHGGGEWPGPVAAVLSRPGSPGHIALGTLDNEWRIDRISSDVVDILGYEPEEVVGKPVLGFVHPADVPMLFAAVGHGRTDQHTVRAPLRVRAKSGTWAQLTAVLASLSDDYPPAVAFAMVPSGSADGAVAVPDRDHRSHWDAQVGALTHDLRLAGMVPRLGCLPDPARLPALSSLTAREWEILILLTEGQRVPTIATDLYVSQSTVRNHLSAIFAKLGVHSQAELMRLLRTC